MRILKIYYRIPNSVIFFGMRLTSFAWGVFAFFLFHV